MKRNVTFHFPPKEAEQFHLFLLIIRDMMKLGIPFLQAIKLYANLMEK